MKSFFFVFSLLVFLPLQGAAIAAPPRAGGLTASLPNIEEEFFKLKSRCEYARALETIETGILALFKDAARSKPKEAKELLARGEVNLFLALDIAARTSRYSDFAAFLARLPAGAPPIDGLVRAMKLRCLLHLGRIEEAKRLRDRLGFITEWNIIGPFENEHGSGFETACGPEKEIDLAARYDGKERKVSWRKLPAEPIDGAVNLNALFKPNDQCLAYALCFIEADQPKEAALRLGSDEAVKVFLNGREVYALDARRLCHFDQDVIGLRLQGGKNALLVKVCDQTGGWRFEARLTAPDGSSLTGVRVTADPEGYAPPEAGPAGKEAPVAVARGALDVFEAVPEKGAAAGNERRHLYLGILHLFEEYLGEDAGEAERHLEKFLEKNPDCAYGHMLLAQARLRRTEMASEKNENPWREEILKALALDPENAEARFFLAIHYRNDLSIPAEARRQVEESLKINPDFLPARLFVTDLLDDAGHTSLARRRIAELGMEEKVRKDPNFLSAAGRIAREEGRNADAAACFRAVLKADFLDENARDALIDIASRSGDEDGAAKLLEERAALHPFLTSPLLSRADLLVAESAYEDAASLLEKAAGINPDDDGIQRKLGLVLDLAGKRDEALARYEKALELNPKARSLRRHVEFLKASAAPFEDAFKVDAAALAAAHPAGPNPDNDPYEYLLRQDIYKVNPDGTSSHAHHEAARILNDKGASTFDVFYTTYARGEQKARFKTARVIHPDGTVEEARIDNRDMSRYERGGFVPAYVDLPALKRGDVVDIEYRIDDIKQSVFGNYFGLKHNFLGSDLEAVKDSRLTLILPKERRFFFNKRFLKNEPAEKESDDGSARIFTWRLENIPKVDSEPRMPGRVEFAPCLEVSTYGKWEELAAWWWRLVKKQCDASAAMKKKVGELTAGRATERDKIRAIYDFVVSDIRYSSAWEFGIHGFKPYKASTIFSNRFGDCKDKAILLRSLLAIAGIEALPVMIHADLLRSREDLTLPLVKHFNHAIAWVPKVDGGPGLFLDGTAQFHPMEALPDMDRGATVVVAREGGCAIRTIPYPKPEENMTRTAYDATLNDSGGALIAVDEEAFGTREAPARQHFLNEGKRENALKSLYGRVFGEVEVKDIHFTDVEDLDVPVHYSLKVAVKDILLKSGDHYQLKAVFFPSGLGGAAGLDERKTDLLMGSPGTSRTRIIYRLPHSLEPEALPEDVRLDTAYGSFSLLFTGGEETISVERSLTLKAPRVPVKDYPIFRDFCRAVEKSEKRMIQIRKVKVK